MIQARAWPGKAIYILFAAALAISLTIMAAPSRDVNAAINDVVSKWEEVPTPSAEDWVLAPNSTIIDACYGDGGDVTYAIVYGWDCIEDATGYWLLKSTNGAATWENITDALEKVRKNDTINELILVATDWVDADFVAVALEEPAGTVRVFVSKDGGKAFKDADEVEDTVFFDDPDEVSDLVVSHEGEDGERDIAIGGRENLNAAALFRCTVDGDSAGAWEDATDTAEYPGWDEIADNVFTTSILVTDLIFSPSWATDRTILAVTVVDAGADDWVHLQSGLWGEEDGAWNKDAGFAYAVPVIDATDVNVDLPLFLASDDARGIAGVLVPSDYSGEGIETRYAWVWVNYYDMDAAGDPVGEIFRVKDALHTSVREQIGGMPWLTNVSYWGTIADGKAIAGVLGNGNDGYADCCEGVQVYRKGNVDYMDICCPLWEPACVGKLPTGRAGMGVAYVSADKAYAVALNGIPIPNDGNSYVPYDESAWSVSYDDGYIWNQLSLVDTHISYLSDVAVSPNCNKIMLVSANTYDMSNYCGIATTGCDSVWLFANDNLPEAPEYTGHWIRTFCFRLVGDNSADFSNKPERGFLRLAPEEDDGDTVYLVDRMTSTIYHNEWEGWNCWLTRSSGTEIDYIVDLAVKDESTIYALGVNGYVSMSDDHGKAITWTDAVDSEVANGWTIAVHDNSVLVGGKAGDVSYSADFDPDDEETFTEVEETTTIKGKVSVAFDSYFDTNNIIYAATDTGAFADNGIYRWEIGEDEKWQDTEARSDYRYTGIVLGFKDGNPRTSAETGGVLYASYVGRRCADDIEGVDIDDVKDCWDAKECWDTGVARSLNPAESVGCVECIIWDYLTAGLTEGELFIMAPQALKICGCTDHTSNTKLFAIAISPFGYDMCKAEYGTVWTFEDCYAKKGPTITIPADGATIPADPCSCYNAPFTIEWDPLCDACYYEIEFALDEDFTTPIEATTPPKELPASDTTSYLVEGGENGQFLLSCEMTYYVRIRASRAGTCQQIRSWWSDPVEFTIAPSLLTAEIDLIAPEGDEVPLTKVSFSWSLLAEADEFDWVLSKNADLSGTHVESKTVPAAATECTKTLEYDTPYYWQVTAFKDGALVSTSDIGTFRTMVEPEEPPEEPEPVTPFWVWVVIAIGAVLVIVVIVLIFRTRRV